MMKFLGLVYLVLIITIFLQCSLTKRNEIVEKKPPEYMEQKVTGDREATARYVQETREEFKKCLKAVLLDISNRCLLKEENIVEKVMEDALNCYNTYFQSMKGQLNLTEEDIREIIIKEEERHRKFYDKLREFSKKFTSEGVRFEILSPGDIYSDPYWDTKLEVGCNIRTDNGAYLSAFPLFPATTFDYMALRQEPVAAHIIYIDEDCMLFINHDQDPGERFGRVCKKLFWNPVDVKDEIEGAWAATLSNNFLHLDSEREFSDTELEELKNKYDVTAVIKTDFGQFTAYIYTGKERKYPQLLLGILD